MTLKESITHHAKEIQKHPGILASVVKELMILSKKPFLLLVGAALLLLLIIPPATYLYFIRDLSSKDKILSRKSAGVILTDRNDKPFFTFYEAKSKSVVKIADIPKYTQQAVISVEDRKFYEHQGFSVSGIGRAIVSDVQQEQLAQGGSTITQQLVKNTLLSQEKSFLRKYQELFLALELERRFSKDDILEMYLNTVYFGEGAFGIQDAAKTYFGTDAKDLTVAQSALLAGILPAPSAYSPLSGDEDKAYQRQELVLDLMRSQNFITKAQFDQAKRQTITFNTVTEDINTVAPHFALMVKDELIKKYGEQKVANSGFRVKTTLDLKNQEYAETVMKSQVTRLTANKATNGAAVAIDPKNGEILALVGSHNWFDENNGKINMALAPRQPGSSFKPIVYSLGLDKKKITPATVLDDKAITYPDGYKPMNYDRKFRDKVIVRRALANSLNIPAVHVMERVGIDDTLDYVKTLGISTLGNDASKYGLSLVLGAGEVPLLQMTNAYAVFANYGSYTTPTTILEVKDKSNATIYTYQPKSKQVIPSQVAFQISSILSDNEARQEVFGGSLTLSRPAAVKTGTTNDYKDALTIGYTPSLVVGVWVGNNDNKPMDSIAGSSGAGPIWRLLMERMFQGTPRQTFDPPLGMIRVTVCKENGLRVNTATTSAYTEFFLSGTVPTRSCTDDPSFPTTAPTQGFPTDTPAPSNTPAPVADTPTPQIPTPTDLIPLPTI